MKILCEYCGAQFDSATNKACPHCGASFNDNDAIEALKAKQQQLDDIEMRQRQLDLDERKSRMEHAEKQRKQAARTQKKMSIGCLVPFLIMVLAFVVFVIFGVYNALSSEGFFSDSEDSDFYADDMIMDVFDEVTQGKNTVEVGFNEVADMGNYTFVCDKVEKADRGVFKPTKGYMYVSFHLVIKNTGEEKIYPFSSVVCSVDGVICEDVFLSDQKDFRPSELPVGLSADGYVCFEVPQDAKTFELRYEDVDEGSVVISVENTIS